MRRVFLLTSLLLFSRALPAQERVNHLMLGPGVFNIMRGEKRAAFEVEYRWDVGVTQLRPFVSKLRPLVSGFVTSKGGLYACGGVAWDIFLGKKLVLTPSFAPGLYYRGKGKDLHFPLEFRSSIELALVFKNQGRLGGQFYHISNASLAHKNPGAEILILFYAIPLPK